MQQTNKKFVNSHTNRFFFVITCMQTRSSCLCNIKIFRENSPNNRKIFVKIFVKLYEKYAIKFGKWFVKKCK